MSKHKLVSWIKSAVRFGGYCCAGHASIGHPLAQVGFALLMVAEFIGVVEEEFE